ncbi:hypothetical protein MK489_02505 [Myxococcota bacterium]|nr:hypothetical protein [Myxococcota bacterium]
MRREMTLLGLLAVAVLSTACSLDVQMQHEPIIATSDDEITFTAEARTSGFIQELQIEMFVNGAWVKSCDSTPCVFEGGPFPDLENDWLNYHTEVTAKLGQGWLESTYSDMDLGYTGITEDDYSWKEDEGASHIPARWGDWTWLNTNVLIQRSEDYDDGNGGLVAFLGDVGDKMIDVLMTKEEIFGNMNDINVYAYRKAGDHTTGCGGTLHADTLADTGAVIDDNAILHVEDIQDCTSGFNQFTAEGSTNTQAFLHEFSHSIFEQADEYDGPTFYFEAANEPNIFSTEDNCRDEQTAKYRDPDDCYQFTARQGGWWGTHTPPTVMTNGLVTHPWSPESIERLAWWFDNN